MILKHIAQSAGRFVITRTRPDPQRLGRGDFNVFNVVPVPQRLEDAVRETCYQHILNRLLTQIMIDTVNLLLVEIPEQFAVKLHRARVIVSERFFDDKALPSSRLAGQPRVMQRLCHGGIHKRRYGKVIKIIGIAYNRLRERLEACFQPLVIGRIVRVHRMIVQARSKTFYRFVVDERSRSKLFHSAGHFVTKLAVGQRCASHPEYPELFGHQSLIIHIVERGDQLAPCQISGRSEDYQYKVFLFFYFHVPVFLSCYF